MKCRFLLFGLLLSCIALLSPIDAQNPKDAKDKDKAEPEKTDVTAQVREMNSDKYASPPTQFREGHVNPHARRQGDQENRDRLLDQAPQRRPIPTPTVYKEKSSAAASAP